MATRSLWTRLDLSRASGVRHPVSDAVLRGAAARAGGELVLLNLDECSATTHDARLEVVAANGGSLRKLFCLSTSWHEVGNALAVAALARAAPKLQVFKTAARGYLGVVISMLCREAPFQALCLTRLYVAATAAEVQDPVVTRAFAAALSGHASLQMLVFTELPLGVPEVCSTVAAALLSLPKLERLHFVRCGLTPASVVAFAQLLRVTELVAFSIDNGGMQLLDAPAAEQLAGALASNHRLVGVQLSCVDLWRCNTAAATLLRAFTAHPSLQTVFLYGNDPPTLSVASTALGALVFANAPALQALNVYGSNFGDAGGRAAAQHASARV